MRFENEAAVSLFCRHATQSKSPAQSVRPSAPPPVDFIAAGPSWCCCKRRGGVVAADAAREVGVNEGYF
jgi:hypothetical protein